MSAKNPIQWELTNKLEKAKKSTLSLEHFRVVRKRSQGITAKIRFQLIAFDWNAVR